MLPSVQNQKFNVWFFNEINQKPFWNLEIIPLFKGCDDIDLDLDNTDQEIPADIVMADQGIHITNNFSHWIFIFVLF